MVSVNRKSFDPTFLSFKEGNVGTTRGILGFEIGTKSKGRPPSNGRARGGRERERKTGVPILSHLPLSTPKLFSHAPLFPSCPRILNILFGYSYTTSKNPPFPPSSSPHESRVLIFIHVTITRRERSIRDVILNEKRFIYQQRRRSNRG